MFRHNLILSLRNFKRNKSSFLINLIGLSTGLACVLLIYLWVADELQVDKFHEKDSQLYQVLSNLDLAQGLSTYEITPLPLASALAEEMPEVEYAISVNDFFNWRSRVGILSNQDKQLETRGLIASKDFFHVFSYPLIHGDKDQVLADKNGVVISEEFAIKLFGSADDVIGMAVEWDHKGFDGVFQITGVFETPPANSTEQFDLLFHISLLSEHDQWSNRWTSSYVDTYVILKKGTDLTAFNEKIVDLMKEKDANNTITTLYAQQYSQKYLYGDYENGVAVGGRIAYVRLFSIIALFILLIACINFMNLSTAQASKKMKAIGVKKAIGANRTSLITQFLSESMLMVFLAMIVAFFLVSILLPQFNVFTGKELKVAMDTKFVLAALSIGLLTSLLAGAYPAFYLSGFNPLTVLKGKLTAATGELWVRKGLVVFQFSLSVLFIIGIFIINQQIELAQTKNLGYDRDNVISFPWKGDLYDAWSGLGEEGKTNEHFYAFMDGLENIPGVVSATNMSGNILTEIYGQSGITWSGQESDRDFSFKSPVVGYNYLETLGMELAAGRSFSKDRNDDYSKVILNEAAVKLMKIENPVGSIIQLNRGSEVVGVVKDFHYGSLYNSIEPLIFRFDQNTGNIITKIQAGTEKATIERLQEYYSEFLPGYTLDFSFMDEDYQALYEAENKISILSKYFAGLAIIITCLGLFGLATFTAERRRKEIGIRKVLGASVISIVSMLTRGFTKTVIVAILIAMPISYLAAKIWLNNFAYSIDLNLWFFIVPSLLVLLIAWATVSMQTLKAARANPVQSLRSE